MGKKVFVDLTQPFSAEIPRWPYFDKPVIDNTHTMAKGGVLTQKITCTMHTGTHCDAPRHVMEYEFDGRRARYTHEMPVDAYTGDAVCLPIDIEPWGLIEPKHLEAACEKVGIKPSELEGMVVCLNTGMHRLFDDSKAYYHYACGTGVEAGKWFVKHKVKCVAMDSQALDHPLHTAMGNNGMTRMNLLGITGMPLSEEYKMLFGEEAYAEFDKFEYIRIHGEKAYYEKFGLLEKFGNWGTWEPCHKLMLGHGIVGVENLGGDLDNASDSIASRCAGIWATAPWPAAWRKSTRTTSTMRPSAPISTAEPAIRTRTAAAEADWSIYSACLDPFGTSFKIQY
jgi:kynurenine formamidase